MDFKYMRIQGRENSWITKYPKGIFGMCWRKIMDGIMDKKDEKIFRDINQWFKDNLPEPGPCKNGEKVITFFKTETTKEMQEKIRPVMERLDKYDHPYDMVYTNYVGTVIYEDEWQVAVRVENGEMI